MRILAIHASHISWRATKKAKFAEEITKKDGSMDGCVVLFSCVEKQDEVEPARVVEGATREIRKRLGMLKVNKVVVFPFAHLTSALGRPEIALQVLKDLEKSLAGHGYEVERAPFGWYKEYDLKSTGHPLSELSMSICPYEGKSCDASCPYCSHPINISELSKVAPTEDI
ncbi:truncated threonyl-tRNA synthetase [Methanocella paludicola SANAE]|uniref:Truncated threonyl-tRNA synthetase n=1 Tax=Methanocella paludicola (strain DSM 17711 / JCM 13418 / NBRC 101707 / SANAE) TaxID=304371 RepID=D1YVK7_METPS|nr:threonyl-tRNA synthetase editing domain-containing protein [Methanocella paludicola]BAI60479.1 truncated threonyl-tRNA synthetase [Methanocella paludicola SANAE]